MISKLKYPFFARNTLGFLLNTLYYIRGATTQRTRKLPVKTILKYEICAFLEYYAA